MKMLMVAIAAGLIALFIMPHAQASGDMPLQITEVHPKVVSGATDSLGKEYIELYNTTNSPIDLSAYQLTRDGNTAVIAFEKPTIAPHEYMVVVSKVSLLDSGGAVNLQTKATPTVVIHRVEYTAAPSGDQSWTNFATGWKWTASSPGVDSIVPEAKVLPLDITEVMGGDKRFVELYNPNQVAVTTTGYTMTYTRGGVVIDTVILPALTIAPGMYGVVPTPLLKNNGALQMGDIVTLTGPDGKQLSQVNVAMSLPANLSWAVFADGWQATMTLTAGAANVLDAPSTARLQLSELLANPAGVDTGHEYVELYNPTTEAVNLKGYALQIGTSTYSLSAQTIAAGGYLAIDPATIGLTLTNTGMTVTLQAPLGDEIDQTSYVAAPDDEAWAYIDESWQFTDRPSRDAANLARTPVTPGMGAVEVAAAESCPEGKYRNSATGRCRSYESDTPAPCASDEYRNPDTGRCRKSITLASATVKPCDPDEFRNPETGRCKKLVSATTEPTPCKEGYERSAETNRCRKIRESVAPAAPFPVKSTPPSAQNTVMWWALGGVGLAAVSYAIWEWRHEIHAIARRMVTLGAK